MNNLSISTSYTTIKHPTLHQTIDFIVLLSFILPLGFLINQIFFAGNVNASNETHTQGDYMLMLTSCLSGIAAIHVPLLLKKLLKIEIPTFLRVMFSAFLFCAIFLGEVRSFYYTVPHWDDLLHLTSGIMTGLLGWILVSTYCKTNTSINLPPFAVVLFAFCFAITIGAVWEIFEFSMDSILGLNMQKVLLQSGEALSGHMAVADTMKDIIVDTCGASIASCIIYFSLSKQKNVVASSVEKSQCQPTQVEDKSLAA